MTFTEYFCHLTPAGGALRVDRLDELVRVGASIDGTFLSPASARAMGRALLAAARDAEAAFAASIEAQLAPEPQPVFVETWSPAFDFCGLPYTLCPAGDGRVRTGDSARVETATRRVWHDDCAEDEARRRQSPTHPPTPASAPPEPGSFGRLRWCSRHGRRPGVRRGVSPGRFLNLQEVTVKKARLLIAGCAVAAIVGACSSYNDQRGRGDAPIGPYDDSPAEVLNFPDQFANVASKCDGHGHRVYSTTREAAVTVVDDPTCAR